MTRPDLRRVLVIAAAGVALVAGGLWVGDYLPASDRRLEGRVDGKSSVVDVEVASDGGDPLPFSLGRTQRHVTVVMEEGPSSSAVSAVLEAYDDDIDDGDVVSVTVELQGTRTELVTCCGTRASGEVIDEVLAAAADPQVLAHSREVLDGSSTVQVELVPLPFDEVVARLEQYAAVEPEDLVTVESGAFLIIRDEQFGPESVARIDARIQLVSELVEEFELAGAVIADRSALRLSLDNPRDRREVARFLAATVDETTIGQVRIIGSSPR